MSATRPTPDSRPAPDSELREAIESLAHFVNNYSQEIDEGLRLRARDFPASSDVRRERLEIADELKAALSRWALAGEVFLCSINSAVKMETAQ